MAVTPNNNSIASAIADGTTFGADDFGTTDTGAEGGEGGSGGDQKPAGLDSEAIRKMLDESINPVKESLAEAQQENALLRGMLQGQRQTQQPPPQQQQQTKAERKRFRDSKPKDELLKDLREQPLETLTAYVEDQITDAVAPVLEKLNEISGNFQRQTQESQYDRASATDVSNLNTNYGHLRDHPAFRPLADRLYNEAVAANGGKYRPGMLSESAAAALAQIVREGKLGNAQTNGNGNGDGKAAPSIRSAFNGSSHGPVGNGRGDDSGNSDDGGDGGTTLASLGYDDINVRAAKKVMAKFGLTEADYVRQIKGQKAVDPNFGGLNRG